MNKVTDLRSASINLDYSLDEYIKMFFDEENFGDKSILSKNNEIGKNLYELGFKKEILVEELKLFYCAQFLIWISGLRAERMNNTDVFIDRFLDKLELTVDFEKFLDFKRKLLGRTQEYMGLLSKIGIEKITHKDLYNLFMEFVNIEQKTNHRSVDFIVMMGLAKYLGLTFFWSLKSTRAVLEAIKDFVITENIPLDSELVSIETKKIFYENKTLKSEFGFMNGNLNGPAKVYLQNGLLVREIAFKNGHQCGIENQYHYYADGKLQNLNKIINEKRNGLCKSYYPSGKLGLMVECRDNIKEGLSRTFFENGKLSRQGRYSGDVRVGNWIFFDENGDLSNAGIYQDGKFQPMGIWDIAKGLGKSLFKK